jgi:hypothetical protein
VFLFIEKTARRNLKIHSFDVSLLVKVPFPGLGIKSRTAVMARRKLFSGGCCELNPQETFETGDLSLTALS